MERLSYYCNGKLTNIGLEVSPRKRRRAMGRTGHGGKARARCSPRFTPDTLRAKSDRLTATRFHEISGSRLRVAVHRGDQACVIPTESVVIAGARKREVRWFCDQYGAEIIEERGEGKWLCRMPGEGDPVKIAFEAAKALFERGNVEVAHPNFLRIVARPRSSSASSSVQWNLENTGNPGVWGADVHAQAAWTLTEGSPDIRVAVLDEGVDTKHPDLRNVVEERDFVDGNQHGRPDGDDAHGTACAGIIFSQSNSVWGLASHCGLVAARIAKTDDQGHWIFDDFETADAIDWCWRDAKADVLSNSWGGGPAVDVINRAFRRAMTRGRGGKGAVIVVAAGNEQGPISYPGTLDGVLTVGASNQWDERKTRNSRDGESWWGSNSGQELDLLAPGVRIWTTDIHGKRGYTNGNFTGEFNGTSAATPHVAAAAAMMLSLNPKLTESRIRGIINQTAEPACTAWDRRRGHGRLNIYAALRQSLP